MNARMRLVHIPIAFIFCEILQAQSLGAKPTLEWVKQLGTSTTEIGYGVSADGHGNIYTTGLTYGSLEGTSAGERDVFLNKYNVSGALLWTRQFGTSSYDIGNAVTADGLGNVYVSGVTGGDLGGPLVGYGDAFISKFDDSGRLGWTRQLGTTHWDTSYGMKADGLGNIYITGYTWGSLEGSNAGQGDAFVSKYDKSGTLLWTRQVGSNLWDISNDVTTDIAGNVILAGFTAYESGSSTNVKDAYVIKYDANGTSLWSKQFGTVKEDQITGVASDGIGNIYVSGFTAGSIVGTNAGNEDVFIRKYNANGDELWTRQFGTGSSDQSYGIAVDVLGNSYVTGFTLGNLGKATAGRTDIFVAKYDFSGMLLWTEQFGTAGYDYGRSVSVDGLGGIYISGDTTGSFQGSNLGGTDLFLARLSDPIPEPASLPLALTAIASVAMRRRRSVL